MPSHSWTPAAPLSHFVDQLWTYEEPAPAIRRERIMPGGTMSIIIDVNEVEVPPANTAVFGGAYSESFILEWPERPVSLVAASFKPGGAFPFLPCPAGELHGAHVEIDAIWGAATRELRQRLAEATTPLARVQTLARWLLARAQRPLALHPAIAYALDEFGRGGTGVTEVGDSTGLSPRRFIELFRNTVGLTPKLFCRVRRFQDALSAVGAGGPVDWVDLALASGYYDQAHFNHDFRAFSGLTPSAYRSGRRGHQNHVPLPD